MSVPDFQSLMLPLLRLASDGQEHTMAATIATLADQLQLDDADRAELLPGGSQRRFHNRVYWAKSHLRAAGLVASPTRGRFKITAEGETVLAGNPPKVDMAFTLPDLPTRTLREHPTAGPRGGRALQP